MKNFSYIDYPKFMLIPIKFRVCRTIPNKKIGAAYLTTAAPVKNKEILEMLILIELLNT